MSEKINPDRKINVVIYARTAREGTGQLDAQVSRLRAYAARRGWTDPVIITECRDSGMSKQVLRAVTGFDVLMAEDFDRIGRHVSGLFDVAEARSVSEVRIVTAAAGSAAEAGSFERLFSAFVAQNTRAARDDLTRRTRAGIAAATAGRPGRR